MFAAAHAARTLDGRPQHWESVFAAARVNGRPQHRKENKADMTDSHVPLTEVLDEALQDPETRAEWERTQLARDVSIWLLGYRRDRGLTQVALAKLLGWKQSVVARLESGEHEPSLPTLRHLVGQLGASARIDLHSDGGVAVRFTSPRRRGVGVRRRATVRSTPRQRTLSPRAS